MLTDEQVAALAALYSLPYSKLSFARAIEAAATAPLLEQIAVFEAQVEQAAQPVVLMPLEAINELMHCNGMSVFVENPRIYPPYCEGELPIGFVPLYTSPPKAAPMTDEQCDAITSGLDDWAREVDHYEFGLPIHADDAATTWRAIIRAATVEKEGE